MFLHTISPAVVESKLSLMGYSLARYTKKHTHDYSITKIMIKKIPIWPYRGSVGGIGHILLSGTNQNYFKNAEIENYIDHPDHVVYPEKRKIMNR